MAEQMNSNKAEKPSKVASIIAGVIVLAVFGYIVIALTRNDAPDLSGSSIDTTQEAKEAEPEEELGTLPKVAVEDYTGKEGLVAFKELSGKGYTVRAKYVNDRVPEASQDLTEDFKAADPEVCEDRLGYDAYIVDDVVQMGDDVSLLLTNKPTMNQTCPDGSIYQP